MGMANETENIVLFVIGRKHLGKAVRRGAVRVFRVIGGVVAEHERGPAAFGGQLQHALQPHKLRLGHGEFMYRLRFLPENDKVTAVYHLVIVGMLQLYAKRGFRVIIPAVLQLFIIALAVADIVVAHAGEHELVLEYQRGGAVEQHVFKVLAVHRVIAQKNHGVVAALVAGHVLQALRVNPVTGGVCGFDVRVRDHGEIEPAGFGVLYVVAFAGKGNAAERQHHRRDDHGNSAKNNRFDHSLFLRFKQIPLL